MEVTIDWRQVEGLRAQGLNDEQVCSALGISKDELVVGETKNLVRGEGSSKNDFGPLLTFTAEQIETARNVIMAEMLHGESSSTRLRAASLILQNHSISAADRYKAAKGLNTNQTINNIMIAVDAAQKMKQATLAEE